MWLLCSAVAGLKYNQQWFSLAFSHSGPRAILLHLVLIIPGSFALVRLLSRKKKDGVCFALVQPHVPQSDLNATSLTPPPDPLLSTPKGLEDGKTPALLRDFLPAPH